MSFNSNLSSSSNRHASRSEAVSPPKTLDQLREATGIVSASQLETSHLHCSALPAGIAQAAITELSGAAGSGKSEMALRFLAENPGIRAAWIESDLTAYPRAFPLHGVDLDRVLFCAAGNELVWCAQQILRSGIFPVVVIAPPVALTPTDLRRIQLGAEQSRSSVLLISEKPTAAGAWTIRSQYQIIRGWSLPQAHPLKLRKSA